jgi:putative ABC transport system permease protein
VREPAEIRRTFDDILQRVRTLRGVEAASLTQAAPYGSGQFITVIAMPVNAPKDSRMQQSEYVSPEYFETVGTRMREGRPFGPEDRFGAPEVMIVDADLARELWPGERVVGRCKSLPPSAPCATVVGISEPRRFEALIKPQGEVFKPLAQWPSYLPQAILVRSGDLRSTAPAVAAVIRSVVPSLAFADVRPMADLVDGRARSWRVGAMLFSLFGGLAVVLGAVGLYASLAFAVRRRTAEIGVRMALGASPAAAARLVLGQGVKLVAIGWCIGTVAALVVADGVRGLLFGVQPTDPTTFVVASLVTVIAGLAGSALPALVAARLNPVVALRSD